MANIGQICQDMEEVESNVQLLLTERSEDKTNSENKVAKNQQVQSESRKLNPNESKPPRVSS